MQFDKYLNNIKRLTNVKEALDGYGIEFSDGDELFIQHMNADLDKFIDILKIKILNKEDKND